MIWIKLRDTRRIFIRAAHFRAPCIVDALRVEDYSIAGMADVIAVERKSLPDPLGKRIICLGPEDTKEANWKRVPIHRELVPVLEDALKISSLRSDKVFLIQDHKGVRVLGTDTQDNPWKRACKKLGLEPNPRFHDLRHTWRTNARRSGVDPQIAESIMGHWFKGKSVNDRYGRISDQELLAAIDKMTFNHGETEILILDARVKAFR